MKRTKRTITFCYMLLIVAVIALLILNNYIDVFAKDSTIVLIYFALLVICDIILSKTFKKELKIYSHELYESLYPDSVYINQFRPLVYAFSSGNEDKPIKSCLRATHFFFLLFFISFVVLMICSSAF